MSGRIKDQVLRQDDTYRSEREAIPALANFIPGYGVSNSRLAPLREFVGNDLIRLAVFAAKWQFREAK